MATLSPPGREQAELARVNRALRVSSASSHAIIHATGERELMAAICRIAVEVGGYRLAWVGLARDDPERRVEPMAQAGFEDGYLERVRITWDDAPRGRGPVGTAIRTGQPCPCQNLLTDPDFAPWRRDAQRRGYASALGLALQGEGLRGALAIYAPEPDAFNPTEVALLQRVAEDLSFGIVALRYREQRDRAERALRESEERYRTLYQEFDGLLEAIGDPLVLLDRNKRVLWANGHCQRLFGRDGRALTGKRCCDLWYAGQERCQVCRLEATFHDGQPERKRITRPDGSVWDMRSFPLTDRDGAVSRVILMATDISEKLAIREQAMRTAHLASLGVMAASVAHEINNPNNLILFNGTLLEQIWRDALPVLAAYAGTRPQWAPGGLPFAEVAASMDELLAGVTGSSRRIRDIIAQMKRLSRPGEGMMDQEVNLGEVVESAVSLLNTHIHKSTSRFQQELPRGLPTIAGNRLMLEQVVVNLLLNALESLPERDRGVMVRLSQQERVGREGAWLCLEVTDQGEGMSDEVRARITNPLFTTKAERGGSGLGLAVVRMIIQRHQGQLEFASVPGEGTTVTVWLPARRDGDGDATAPA